MAYKLVVAGTGGSGKSSSFLRFAQNMEKRLCSKFLIQQPQRYDRFDKRLRKDYTPTIEQWYRPADGYFLVYSITNRDSFNDLRRYRDIMVRVKANNYPTMVLVGNKSDLENQRQVYAEEGAQLAREWNCPFFETSAKLDKNTQEAFIQLARNVKLVKSAREFSAPAK